MSTRIRCAIYTRKSTDDGLEQEFNSLQAQREACEAYIISQRGSGWVSLAAEYDDGGLSGGTMERPALQALLRDIAARKVDLVVVYKVDRLTRSLADFAKIVEILDGRGISFVSVTQQFNTTTSMGRLTLNMLLSFAQFEREVTGERIRDKIAASKRKGMWMGGLPPLGYDVVDRKLNINSTEAETVRQLYQLYLELGSVRTMKIEADRLGLVTKRRQRDGQTTGGGPFSRGNLYQLLHNPLYVGEIAHKGETYPGQHEGIIDRNTWNGVQAMLTENAQTRERDQNSKSRHLLGGRIFDETGDPLCTTYGVKNGRRYLYYVSRRQLHAQDNRGDGWRLPAGEVERVVRNGVCEFLNSEVRVVDALSEHATSSQSFSQALPVAAALGAEIASDSAAGRRHLARLVRRVVLTRDSVRVGTSMPRLFTQGSEKDVYEPIDEKHLVEIELPVTLKKRGVESKLVVLSQDNRAPDQRLVGLVARSHRWMEQLAAGEVNSVREIARLEDVDEGDVSRFLPLAFLEPRLMESLVHGKQPTGLTSEALRQACPIPHSWEEQCRHLSFA